MTSNASRSDSQSPGRARQRVLLLAQLPPPVHGVTMTTSRVQRWLETEGSFAVGQTWSGSAARLTDIDSRTLGKLWSFVALNLRLAGWLLTGRRFDIAYVTLAPWTHAALRDALAAWWGRRLARRTLVHLHGEGLSEAIGGRGFKARLMRALLRGTELIAITGRAKADAASSGLFARVLRLPNAAPDPGSPALDKAVDAVEAQPLRIGFLGNLDPRKGVLDLLPALQRLVAAGWPFEATIAGGSTPYLSVEGLRARLSEQGLDGYVRAVGAVHGAAKDELLRNLDIFLYPSKHDHAPLVVIEALSHGVVPIVVDTGGAAEIVGADLEQNVVPAGLTGDDLTAELVRRIAPYRDGTRLAADRRLARARFLAAYTEARFDAGLDRIFHDWKSPSAVELRGAASIEPQRVRSAMPSQLKAPFTSLVRTAHARFARRPLPDRIGVYFHGLGASERHSLAECVATVRSLGYRILPVGDYLAAPRGEKVCSLSFDDCYASWHEALGLLDELDVKATFYVNSLPFRDTCAPSEIAAYFGRIGIQSGDATLSRAELRDLADAGHEIGCHSHSHYMLSSLPEAAWDREIRASRVTLEDIIGREVRHFSWPYGMPRHITDAQKDYCLSAGFTSIAAATPGMLHRDADDPRQLARSEWRTGRSPADNLIDMAIDGRHFTRITGRSVVG